MTQPLPEDIEDQLYELLLGEQRTTSRQAALEDLLQRHPEHREAMLSRAQLLEAGSTWFHQVADPAAVTAPEHIGPYRIVRQLGEGGFGTVWLAEQREPLHRFVAVKQIRHGMDTARVLQRFTIERVALQQLEHPGIARVLDAGTANDGRPFLVTEFVDGVPLLQYTRAHDSTLAARLSLLLQVIDAVHHAHQRGVLHRDLKPANLLVTDRGGSPRAVIIDFGLARVLRENTPDLTAEGQLIGTPEYMSPEQLAGSVDLDVRVDVHALGMLLFELLVGDLPVPRQEWRSSPLSPQIERKLTQDPPRPSSRIHDRGLAQQVRNDLDWITLRALARDREHRYRSAAQLADDVRRYLRHEPVLAGPPGLLYHASKFFRRHRLAVFATGAVLASLTFGLIESLRQQHIATARAAEAASHLADFDRLADALLLDELRRAAAAAWPAMPDRLPELRTCRQRLTALLDRRDAHRRAMAALQARIGHGDAEADLRSRFLCDRLRTLLQELELETAATGLVASLDERIDIASTLQQRSLVDTAELWRRAAQRVEGNAHYAGLSLSPQLGLVPIGPDPDSGLEEFVHLASGDIPVRDPANHLQPAPEHGIVLVLLPGGTFTMGIQDDDASAADYDATAGPDSQPRHEVQLAPFLLGKFELTRTQYQRLRHTDPSLDPSDPDGHRPDRALLPVSRLTWTEAHTTAWQWDLVLPTEAQWEYACRAGTRTTWSTGADAGSLRGFANIADLRFANEFADGRPATQLFDDGYLTMSPIGVLRANAFGLCDMHGNVAEYCEDAYCRYTEPCRAGDGLRQAAAPPEGRVLRGGSFHRPAERASSGNRDGTMPDVPSLWIGMRPARRLDR